MKELNIFYPETREEWRKWLEENFEKEEEVWFVFPLKSSGKKGVIYNDAVEEALCFGWIDSINKGLDEHHKIQRFTPRRKGSDYSRPNIERLIWLNDKGMVHEKIKPQIIDIINEPYTFPEDIIETLKRDEEVFKNYTNFTEPYKRIRIAYIDAARKRPDEFNKRLNNFIAKTKENKIIKGYGGIDKYYI